MQKRAAAAVFFLAVTLAALAPIRSYDAFWHFASGRWIVEHRALPTVDPLAVASEQVPWINGEWLWQAGAYGVMHAFGPVGVSWVNALFVAAIFTLALWLSAREHDLAIAAALAAVGFAGASDRLGVRPLTAASLLIVIAVALLARRELPVMRLAIAYAAVTVVWINVHPSALLAPLLAIASLLIDVRRWRVVAASAGALLINPHGWRAIAAPLRLSSLVTSGEFVNAEWQMSPASYFPLLYVSIVIIVIWYLASRDKRANAWRFVLFAGLAFLAVRHVRNQGLYFAALPLVVPPLRKLPRNVAIGFLIAALIPIGWVLQSQQQGSGFDDERFPLRAVARLRTLGLGGNIYNVDQFGGLLEWTFYPQRRVLTDGRNELFHQFIAEDAAAHENSRAWMELLAKYRVDVAVDEYSANRMQVVDARTGETRSLPASLVRYRRRDWALVAFDDAAMIFARRAAFPAAKIDAAEYRFLVPDDPGIGYASAEIKAMAQQELARAKREIGDVRVVQEMERGAAQ
jgi:hypothetical protein